MPRETYYAAAAQIIPLLLVVLIFEARVFRESEDRFAYLILTIGVLVSLAGEASCVVALYFERDWFLVRMIVWAVIMWELVTIAVFGIPQRQRRRKPSWPARRS